LAAKVVVVKFTAEVVEVVIKVSVKIVDVVWELVVVDSVLVACLSPQLLAFGLFETPKRFKIW
jgi:hypothetical protein